MAANIFSLLPIVPLITSGVHKFFWTICSVVTELYLMSLSMGDIATQNRPQFRVEIHPLIFSYFVFLCKYIVIVTPGSPKTLKHRSPPIIYEAVWASQKFRKTQQREYIYSHRVLNLGCPAIKTYLLITLMSNVHSRFTHYKNVVVPTAGTTGFVSVAASQQQLEMLKRAKYLVRHTEIYSYALRNYSSKLSFQILMCNAMM